MYKWFENDELSVENKHENFLTQKHEPVTSESEVAGTFRTDSCKIECHLPLLLSILGGRAGSHAENEESFSL